MIHLNAGVVNSSNLVNHLMIRKLKKKTVLKLGLVVKNESRLSVILRINCAVCLSALITLISEYPMEQCYKTLRP